MKNNDKIFNFEELPSAYFKDNDNSKELRKHLIKQQVGISENGQDNLEDMFFSDENIIKINKKLILTVFNKSNKKYKINPQSKESLIIIMRYVYIEYARNLPFDIEKQTDDLNCIVIGEILPNIFTNITQKIEYLKNIQSERKLLDLPINVNKSSSLPSISSLYF